MKNNSFESNMDKIFEGLLNLIRLKMAGNHYITMSMAKSITRESEKALVEYMANAGTLVKKFTGVKCTKKELGAVMLGMKPSITIKTNQGWVGFVHGDKDGSVMGGIEWTMEGPKVLKINPQTRKFAELFPEVGSGESMSVISCYPGAKPRKWEVQGRTFKNLGDRMLPIFAILDEDREEMHVGFATPHMNDFYVNHEEEFGQLLQGSIKSWMEEGYSFEEICELA